MSRRVPQFGFHDNFLLSHSQDQLSDTGFLKPMPLHVISQELSVPGLASTCGSSLCFWLPRQTHLKLSSRHLLCNVDCSLCVESERSTQEPGLPVRQRHEDNHLILDKDLHCTCWGLSSQVPTHLGHSWQLGSLTMLQLDRA